MHSVTGRAMPMKALAVIETLLLALWVGTMAGFAGIFAPTAFHSIGNLDLFAALIAQTLRTIDVLGFGAGAVLLAIIGAQWPEPAAKLRFGCVSAMLIATATEHFAIIPHMRQALYAFHGSLQKLAPNAPARAAYDALHHESSMIYGIALLLGLVALSLRALVHIRGLENPRAADARER